MAEREMERAERERERVDFERKLQAQIEYVIRAVGIQPPIPPSDGSSPLQSPRLKLWLAGQEVDHLANFVTPNQQRFNSFVVLAENWEAIEVLDQNLYYAGMAYTSATFAVAMLERVNLKSIHSHGKIVGTLVTVGGAMIMTLIKGHTIGLPWTKTHTINYESTSTSVHQDPTKGAIMITIGCFCWASFVILQAVTLKTYPAELSLTALICGGGTLQGAILTLIVEKGNTSIWSIHFDTKLLAALYSGLICTGLSYYVSGIIMREKGPVFATAFNPLNMVIVAIMGSFILSEYLDIGRRLNSGNFRETNRTQTYGLGNRTVRTKSLELQIVQNPTRCYGFGQKDDVICTWAL
ncbi:hypothetical protein LguiA_002962 [Lonicera macranthoides]